MVNFSTHKKKSGRLSPALQNLSSGIGSSILSPIKSSKLEKAKLTEVKNINLVGSGEDELGFISSPSQFVMLKVNNKKSVNGGLQSNIKFGKKNKQESISSNFRLNISIEKMKNKIVISDINAEMQKPEYKPS